MKASKGELKIHDILTNAGVLFKEEYTFPDLLGRSGHPLRFDFAVFGDDEELDFLIEFQGIQHYKPRSKFGGIEGLRQQQYYDMLKRKYCEEHNITLVTIPYIDEDCINYDYIFSAAGY